MGIKRTMGEELMEESIREKWGDEGLELFRKNKDKKKINPYNE